MSTTPSLEEILSRGRPAPTFWGSLRERFRYTDWMWAALMTALMLYIGLVLTLYWMLIVGRRPFG